MVIIGILYGYSKIYTVTVHKISELARNDFLNFYGYLFCRLLVDHVYKESQCVWFSVDFFEGLEREQLSYCSDHPRMNTNEV